MCLLLLLLLLLKIQTCGANIENRRVPRNEGKERGAPSLHPFTKKQVLIERSHSTQRNEKSARLQNGIPNLQDDLHLNL